LELFHYDNMPALSIFYGDRIVMAELPGKETDQGGAIAHGYAMDEHHEFDGAATLAREVIEHMVDDGVDVGACNAVSDPSAAGIGHAVGFVERRILRDGSVPVIPFLVNAMYPPNQPTPERCFEMGRALRRAIEASSSDARVAVIASGGLSHYVVNEELDRAVLDSLAAGDEGALLQIPPKVLVSGSAEIRNWISMAGAAEEVAVSWCEYVPCYRSLAGTGCGMAFARWS